MAGPHVQHPQRPSSAYYNGLTGNTGGSGGGGGGASGSSSGVTSGGGISHTGLHALRQMSQENELIYRGSNGNTINSSDIYAASTSRSIRQHHHQYQQQYHQHPNLHRSNNNHFQSHQQREHHSHQQQQQQQHQQHHRQNSSSSSSAVIRAAPQPSLHHAPISSIAGHGSSASDALIVPCASAAAAGGIGSCGRGGTGSIPKSASRHSVEIVVNVAQCGQAENDLEQGHGDGDEQEQEESGVEDGGSGNGDGHRKSSRHRQRPLHRRVFTYVRSLFQSSTTANDSELEDFETPARYRPESLSALHRSTRFPKEVLKRIYRGFKAECPNGVVKEENFKFIFSQFFPQGGNPTLYAHYVFQRLDHDHTGIISFEDFILELSRLTYGSDEDKIRWIFGLYDANGDGLLTREELTDIVTAIFELQEFADERIIKDKVERLFQTMDTNGDGVISQEEFVEGCLKNVELLESMKSFAPGI